METQGPPPPPTSTYAYFHSNYLQSPHYGALPFDPSHPMYRGGISPMMVPPGAYTNPPYIHHPQMHAQIPRFHAPEDLSRSPSAPTKALDLLHHQASQYYPSHKIHELQERAIKSPTPKLAVSTSSPSVSVSQQSTSAGGSQGIITSNASAVDSRLSSTHPICKTPTADGKDSRSPPPQRHVHTHHHTHVGLGYPILPTQYPGPYGATVLASQQAATAASTVINPYIPKWEILDAFINTDYYFRPCELPSSFLRAEQTVQTMLCFGCSESISFFFLFSFQRLYTLKR